MVHKSRRAGFSLLELVAVVTLIGIVSAVVMQRLSSTDSKTSINNTTAANTRSIQVAVERYYFDNSVFPTNVTDLVNGSYLAKAPTILEAGKSYSIGTDGTVTYQ